MFNCLINFSLTQVNAADADSGDNAAITYTITSPTEYFTINHHSGVISTAQSLLNNAAISVHRLELFATDGGNPAMTTTGEYFICITNIRATYKHLKRHL